MARLYSNENFPLGVVKALRQLGHDVLTVQETGNAGQGYPDNLVLASAVSNSRIILTFNRKHFRYLHQKSSNHFGIIICTFDSDFNALAQRIHSAIESEQDTRGKLMRVNRPPT